MKVEISYDTKTGLYEEHRDGVVTHSEKLDSFEMNWNRAGSITMKAQIAQPKTSPALSGITYGNTNIGTAVNGLMETFTK